MKPGFAAPVPDAQRCFRAILDAFARPGTIRTMPDMDAPAPLQAAAACVLLTLADQETPLWLGPEAAAAREWLAFHTGAPETDLSRAMFAAGLRLPDTAAVRTGTDEAPEEGATVIVQLPSVVAGPAFRLAGPGLRTPRPLRATGLPADFAAVWQRNRALFPRGFDLILCAGRDIVALPRSVTVEEG